MVKLYHQNVIMPYNNNYKSNIIINIIIIRSIKENNYLPFSTNNHSTTIMINFKC